jgi:hypothetical protein
MIDHSHYQASNPVAERVRRLLAVKLLEVAAEG